MATLVLQLAGAALGQAVGGPIGAIAGRALGAVAGAAIDTGILGAGARASEGPRLGEMAGLSSTEGAPIPRLYGRARLGGELIWATRFEEIVHIDRDGGGASGGKGGLFGGGAPRTTYSYFANIAVGLCEGPIAFVRRVWADGRPLDLTRLTMRVYRGDETQAPDPLIVAKEGAENAPAYRGLAYVVFERMPLADFGNRIPQLAFEVARPVGTFNARVRGVNLIPGAGEFAYETTPVFRNAGDGVSRAENVNQLTHATDLDASLDQLQALYPNCESVTLIVTWFGEDLRTGHCTLRPKVENAIKITSPRAWRVAGLNRADAQLVSVVGDRPAYGGTPSDASVLAAIAELKARGFKVNLHPFVMMDVPAGNALENPWTGAAPQPAYPWRGDLSADPAPGRPGTADGTAAAAAQIAAFVGAASPADFSAVDGEAVYAGPDEWSLRRFVLHYATLAEIAGGVDAFVIGSELRGLTRLRDASGGFPMTDALVALAADARTMLGGGTKITYAADWTEYGGVVPEAGTLTFPLDALWASPAIDMIGIDWYPPLGDWRDGAAHLDATVASGPWDSDYLASRVAGGEAFDWFYADDAARRAQIRLPIADGAHGKPWVYRAKDLVGWWSNAHVARAGGVETSATAWTPMAKPVWLMEVGCPAVDRGANAPNLFPDAKSSASALPPFSRGARDDLVAVRAVAATLEHFDPGNANAATLNPLSPVYGGRMVEAARTHLWAWDARPFPAFPSLSDIWGDAENYERGHSLNGRAEAAPLDDLLRAVAADFGVGDIACEGIDGFIDGYVVDRPMSFRAAVEPLARLHGFDLRGGRLAFAGGRRPVAATLGEGDLVADDDGRVASFSRAQETELPAEIAVGYSDADNDYRHAAVLSRRLAGSSRRQSFGDAALVGRRAAMQRLADMRLQNAWTARETARFSLPPARLALEAGDRVALAAAGVERVYEIRRILDGAARMIEAAAVDDSAFDHAVADWPANAAAPPAIAGAPRLVLLDLPVARGTPAALQYAAAFADPWPGSLTVWRKIGGDFVAERTIAAPAMIGALIDDLPPGPLARWDRAAAVRAAFPKGALASLDDGAALAGGNAFALLKPDGAWEILFAAQAELVGPNLWRLSRLLRGLGGSEDAANLAAPAGALIVRLDGAVVPVADSLDALGATRLLRIGATGLDHADPRFVEVESVATPLALKPFAPVHVRARRGVDGVTLSWIRRSRIDGDAWGLDEIPLGEEGERYEIDIHDGGGAVLRTLTSAAPQLLYPAADEIADFGAPQASLDVSVAQLSATVGRGFARRRVMTVQ